MELKYVYKIYKYNTFLDINKSHMHRILNFNKSLVVFKEILS